MLKIENLSISYGEKKILEAIHLLIPEGASYALLGRSGSGKSTLAKAIAGLIRPQSGIIYIDGAPVNPLGWSKRHSPVQMIFQDPYSSLNPSMRIRSILAEPFQVMGKAFNDRILEKLLHEVQLEADILDRYPETFSGGQRQRIAIARALAASPKLLILDESLSALDVIAQLDLLEMLKSIQRERKMTYLYITHQERTAKYLCERILELSNGRIHNAEYWTSDPQSPF